MGTDVFDSAHQSVIVRLERGVCVSPKFAPNFGFTDGSIQGRLLRLVVHLVSAFAQNVHIIHKFFFKVDVHPTRLLRAIEGVFVDTDVVRHTSFVVVGFDDDRQCRFIRVSVKFSPIGERTGRNVGELKEG